MSLMVPLLVLGTTSSAQAAPQCLGQDPTLVGTPGGEVVGTPGDDVVLSNGATRVDTLAGADLVCVTGGAGTLVDTGEGDDTVDAAGSGTAVDTVSTGGGRDNVLTGRSGEPMSDVVETGPGRDALFLRGLPGPGRVNAGGQGDYVYLEDRSHAEWEIDNRRGEVSTGGDPMEVEGAARFMVSSGRWASISFLGGPDDEWLITTNDAVSNRGSGVGVDMGGGDDLVSLRSDQASILHGGDGDDEVQITGPRKADSFVDADLADGTVEFSGGDLAKVTAFAAVKLFGFGRNTVRLGGAPDRLLVQGCRSTVHAGGGADLVRLAPAPMPCTGPPRAQALRAYGEGGSDRLQGSSGNDVLIGGAGSDVAVGRQGTDVCVAEERRKCERR